MRISDWSSDVCSSDLPAPHRLPQARALHLARLEHHVAVGQHHRRAQRVQPLHGFKRAWVDALGEGVVEHVAGHAQRSEEHTSELQSLMRISYAVFCLKKKIR